MTNKDLVRKLRKGPIRISILKEKRKDTPLTDVGSHSFLDRDPERIVGKCRNE